MKNFSDLIQLAANGEATASLTASQMLATILAMPRTQPFEIVFDERVIEHLECIESKYDVVIRHAIETQLRFEPYIETRNRKLLRAPSTLGATWELRCGPQ